MPAAPIIGIDLGTTTSMVCVANAAGTIEIIQLHPDMPGEPGYMPSAFLYTGNECLIGRLAENQRGRYGEGNIVRNIKRAMNDPLNKYKSGGEIFNPIQISSRLLEYMRQRAEQQLKLPDGSITEAVITVPAHFGDIARRATEAAAHQAGLKNTYLLPEPVAAAIGLGLHTSRRSRLVVVVDLGGGTLDITLLMLGRNVGKAGFRILAMGGDVEFGGLNWDEKIARQAVETYLCDVYDCPDPLKLKRMLNIQQSYGVYKEAERLKILLNMSQHLEQDRFVIDDPDLPENKESDYIVTRTEFHKLSLGLAQHVAAVCDALLREVQEEDCQFIADYRRRWYQFFRAPEMKPVGWSDIDGLYLVGGGGLIQEVQDVLKDRCGGVLPKQTLDPQHCVAFGAARCAASLVETPDLFRRLRTRSPHTYGVFAHPKSKKQPTFHPLIHQNTVLPYEPQKPARFRVRNRGDFFSVKVVEVRVLSSRAREVIQMADRNGNGADSEWIPLPTLPGRREIWLDAKNDREYHVVAVPRIEDIGTTEPEEGEQVYFRVRYPESGSLVFSVKFRGKLCEVKLDSLKS
ncbi:MAG: Hsp70 family protein [Fuerstiella sp.]